MNPYNDEDALETAHAVAQRNAGARRVHFIEPTRPAQPLPIVQASESVSERISRALAGAAPSVPVKILEGDGKPELCGERSESKYDRGRWKTVTRGTLRVEVGERWLEENCAWVCRMPPYYHGATPSETLTNAIDGMYPMGNYCATYRETVRSLTLAKLMVERLNPK